MGHGFCVCAGRCRHAAFFFFLPASVFSAALFALVSKPVVLGATNLEGWKEMCTNWGSLFLCYFFLNICVVIFPLSLFLAWSVYPSFIFVAGVPFLFLFCLSAGLLLEVFRPFKAACAWCSLSFLK